jgi:hypothetical protein
VVHVDLWRELDPTFWMPAVSAADIISTNLPPSGRVDATVSSRPRRPWRPCRPT